MTRDIDHLVIAVNDLEAARADWQRLGFTVSPITRHSFGTANAVVQLDGTFIELLAIADPSAIAEAGVGAFSFAAFNRDFLKLHAGISMLALASRDPDKDRDDFEAAGLPVFAPFGFERTATGPDGIDRKVGFSLTFTAERRLRQVGFFTCRHHHPENFWRAGFHRHVNGARRIASAVLVARDPADFHEFLSKLTGQHDMTSTSLGLTLDLGRGAIEVQSPIGYQAWFGESCEPDPRRLLACRIAVADISKARKALDLKGISCSERMGALVVPPSAATGATVAFVDEKDFRL
jgi:hypothetical protein